MAACAGSPLTPWSADGPPLVVAPAASVGVHDRRGRFREIACAVIDARAADQPGYQPCREALTGIGEEPGATGAAVDLGPSRRGLVAALVPGIGWDCFGNWIGFRQLPDALDERSGFPGFVLEVDGLSGSTNNARQIRERILADADRLANRSLVLIGYSKGAPDSLEALVAYPEIRRYVAAMVSVAGAIGGSPLANIATEGQLDLLRHVPDANCTRGDDQGIESLQPAVRRAWLAEHPLPQDIPYYSVVSLPTEDRISAILRGPHRRLARIDPRNDGQLIAWDQIIPGSTLVAYLNADHWAVAVPIAESHPFLGRTFVNHNDYPWRAILEAILRFVEEDLERRDALSGNR
ncbi:MAG: hypothetical protein P8Y52_00320 [Xanthomonadales bacterium]